ncbi:anaerobic sulfatase maturase [Vibrio renipiscarius]|uniref:anaerobic sulfatase maturase n=1 Tax=Vibrio renipiscarius TaxID=1461322 RepID=UPI000699588B|nr:anaerobic sulfatase maturase [Vibrio renipiscarius]
MKKATNIACHVMAKPTGSICNLDCHYCFYLEKEALYPERVSAWKMPEDVLREYIRQYIENQPSNYVDFLWQGGEPLMMGIEFFAKAVEISTELAKGKIIRHSIQTNGVLINDNWANFFKKNNILIGISIDGPQKLHDTYRVTRSGKGSYQKVLAGLETIKKHHVEFNILTVVGSHNVDHPIEVYQHLKALGAKHIQFIPLVEEVYPNNKEANPHITNLHVTKWTTPALAYGKFLTKIFNKWIREDIGDIFVQTFDSTFASWNGLPSGVCVTSRTCGHALALEANGDLYQCDHYVEKAHKLGNIKEETISKLNNSAQAISFGKNKYDHLSQHCKQCQYQFACFGGCPKHRFATDDNGIKNINYLCDGYFYFFDQTAPYMKAMKDLLLAGYSPSCIKTILSSNSQAL